MKQVNVHEAKTHLSRLIEDALGGEEIIIARDGKPLVRLTPLKKAPLRVGGQGRGLFAITPDFDETTPELVALFEGADEE